LCHTRQLPVDECDEYTPVPQSVFAQILDSAKTTSLVDGDNVTNKSAAKTAASNSVKSVWENEFL